MSGFILLRQRTAEENYDGDLPLQRVVSKGELLLGIPLKDRIFREDGAPSHNYSLYSDPAVTLYDDGTDVAPLNVPELDYLVAVTTAQTRIAQYHEEGKLEWIKNLNLKDVVFFRLKHGSSTGLTVHMVKGRIRYYGFVPGFTGVMFGMEIMDPEHKGKGTTDGSPHFNCGHNNAVYVPMNEIIKLKDFSENIVKWPYTTIGPVTNTCSSKSSTHQPNEEGKDKSLFEKAKGVFKEKVNRVPPFTTTTNLSSDVPASKFSSGDHVVIQTADNLPVRGIVRWTGPLRKMSRSEGGIVIPVVGIETVRPIDNKREFPGLSYAMTGSHGEKLFEVSSKHGRIFLSELAVLSADEYKQQKKKERTAEARDAQKWGLSVKELKQQRELLAERNEEYKQQKKKEHMNYFIDEMKCITAEIDKRAERVSITEQQLMTEIKELQEDKRVLCKNISKLTEMVSGLLKVNQEQTENLNEERRRNTTLTNEALDLLTNIMEMKRTTKELSKQNDLVVAENTALKESLTHLETEHQQLLKHHETEKNEHQKTKKEKEKEKEKLQKDHEQWQDELKEELSRRMAEKATLVEKITQFEQSWRISHKDVTVIEELGRGAWGSVSVGVFREQRVAIKQLHNLIMSDSSLAVVNREINTMCKLHHPNLLLFIGAALDHPSGNPLIVTEIMEISLRQAYEKGQLTEEASKLSILRDTAAGLNYLHCHPDEIIHRDVSSANVLLESRGSNKWRAKLADFGSANIARKAFTQTPGAAVYSAPEAQVSLLDEDEQLQTTKMNVYSYGVLACEVIACRFPESPSVFRAMLESVPKKTRQLIQDCIHKDPSKRPIMNIVISKLDKIIV